MGVSKNQGPNLDRKLYRFHCKDTGMKDRPFKETATSPTVIYLSQKCFDGGLSSSESSAEAERAAQITASPRRACFGLLFCC